MIDPLSESGLHRLVTVLRLWSFISAGDRSARQWSATTGRLDGRMPGSSACPSKLKPAEYEGPEEEPSPLGLMKPVGS